jgi:leucyl-tRNA synthetase
MKYKLVIKHAFNELSSLKESYLIATGGVEGANPVILFKYIETLLLLLNPIIPHFCQY